MIARLIPYLTGWKPFIAAGVKHPYFTKGLLLNARIYIKGITSVTRYPNVRCTITIHVSDHGTFGVSMRLTYRRPKFICSSCTINNYDLLRVPVYHFRVAVIVKIINGNG